MSAAKKALEPYTRKKLGWLQKPLRAFRRKVFDYSRLLLAIVETALDEVPQ